MALSWLAAFAATRPSPTRAWCFVPTATTRQRRPNRATLPDERLGPRACRTDRVGNRRAGTPPASSCRAADSVAPRTGLPGGAGGDDRAHPAARFSGVADFVGDAGVRLVIRRR